MRNGRASTVALLCSTVALLVLASSALAGPHFYFAQLTDTHFGGHNHAQRTRQAVNSINQLPMEIAFVAHTGDITSEKLSNTGVVASVTATLDGLEAPIHYVPGNHDLLCDAYDTLAQVYTNHFGDLISQQEYHGVLCLFVYTEPLAVNFSVPNYEPLVELEARLKAADGKPAIIFHHTPSVEDFYNNEMHEGWQQAIRDQWISLLNAYNVKGVIAGHFHRDEHHWLGDVPLYVSSSIACYWGRQATYRIYEYKDGKLGYRTQYLPWNTNILN
ncbi:MAG: hypothetical protein HN341_04300 [Verrucomicrobia bacterium]|jgi:3',5'-cyclic AMP phosphodiesterase CpdA|nr:hypothetical protein [Verrucomicrobiota bacterium]